MDQRQRNNFYKSITGIGIATRSACHVFEQCLTSNGQSLEDFINLHRHDICHLCYNKVKCPHCTKGYQLPYEKVLCLDQLENLFDSGLKLPCHAFGNLPKFYCCKSRIGVQIQDLDLTLIRCLLVNFCQDLFWIDCLKGGSFEDFLNKRKHDIFHMWQVNKNCCQCPAGYSYPCCKRKLSEHEWKLLFNNSITPCNFHTQFPLPSACCSWSAFSGIKWIQLDRTLRITLLDFCELKKDLEKLIKLRNNIQGHRAAREMTYMVDAEFIDIWMEIEDVTCNLITHGILDTSVAKQIQDEQIKELVTLVLKNKILDDLEEKRRQRIDFSAIMCCTETSEIVLQGKHQSRAIDLRMCEPRLFQRSFSDTGQGPLMLSRSVQTDLTPERTCLQDTDDTHAFDTTSDRENDKGYEKVCSDLKGLKENVQQLTSAINISGQAQMPEIINREKTFAKITENSTNLILTIERQETMADKTMSPDIEHIINDQEFTAIRYGTTLKNIDTVSKVQNESSLQKNKESYNIFCDLLRVRIFQQSHSQFCPLSLRTYFESFTSDMPLSNGESMSNELLRVSSYTCFPRDIDINLIKMAKTGFYYIDGRKTKCFSCGVTYDKWKSGDNPVVMHAMLSPSCVLVAGPTLSSSANQEERTTVVSNNNDSSVDTRTVASRGLSQSENASSTSESILQISSPYNGTSNNVQERQGNQLSSPSNRDRTSTATGNETQTSNENHNATGTSSCQHNTEFESLGIHLEKPKYPNYACLTVRISSFEGWPPYLDQSPRQMALAGFLLSGYHDCTRCFFCGGSLRNWEAGDDPWVEHARWFPKCTFLKQNKGEKFINAVQTRQEEIDRETNATQETTPRAQTYSLVVNNSTTSTTRNVILQTAAARSVIEFGYTEQQVINAFQHITLAGKDMTSILATDVLNILLDDEAHHQQQGATADVIRHGNNTNTAGDQKSDSTSTQCNGLDTTVIEQNLLFDDIENLIEENRQLRDQRLCKVCLDLEASIAFLLCGHIVCCIDCTPAMRKCPVCRTYSKKL